MKKKGKIFWCISIICLIGSYVAFLHYYGKKDVGESPMILFDSERIEISVKDEESVLLNGVIAYDKEDGNLSKEVFVESISAFDENKDRTVTYAVFDSNKHVVKAIRKIHYRDYVQPKFYLKEAFISNALGAAEINRLVGATSCVDGDISQKVNVETKMIAKTDDLKVHVTVKDSTGEGISLNLLYNYDRNTYTTDILLKDYLVYIKTGESFDTTENIEKINSKSVLDDVNKYLMIKDNINNQVPGIYEVEYSFNHFGDNGLTKCIVVVEE